MDIPLPTISEKDIEEAMDSLLFFEEWCNRTDTAPSALGRKVLEDQALIFRWRERGKGAASPMKRRTLAIYCLTHPEGIPGYTRRKSGRRRQTSFTPGGTTPSGSRSNDLQTTGPSTAIPVPATDMLEMDDFEYVKTKAFTRGCAIAVVLAEMVALGIRCDREAEYEEGNTNDEDSMR